MNLFLNWNLKNSCWQGDVAHTSTVQRTPPPPPEIFSLRHMATKAEAFGSGSFILWLRKWETDLQVQKFKLTEKGLF